MKPGRGLLTAVICCLGSFWPAHLLIAQGPASPEPSSGLFRGVPMESEQLRSAEKSDSARGTSFSRGIAVSAGLGVCYVDAVDIVNLVNSLNATSLSSERASQFKAAVEFFGTAAIQVSPDWVLTLDYGYLLGSYNADTQPYPAQITFTAHLPSLVLHYVLADEGVYNFRVGGGLGYHFGMLSESYGSTDLQYSGKGVGMLIDLEGNTAFGEHLFAYLGATLRWEFIGDLTNAAGVGPFAQPTTLHMFGVGARLGFTYYF